MDEQRYGAPVLDRIMNLYTIGGGEPIHLAFMVSRPGALPPVGPFLTIGEAMDQAAEDRYLERKHDREAATRARTVCDHAVDNPLCTHYS